MIHLTSPPLARLAVHSLVCLALIACSADPSSESAADASAGTTSPIPAVTAVAGTAVPFVVTDAEGSSITWSALSAADGRTGVASIDTSGLFRAAGAGGYLVVASRGREHAYARVTVTEGAPAAAAAPVALTFAAPRSASSGGRMSLSLDEFWIEASPDTLRLSPGASAQLHVLGHSVDGATWSIRPEWQATAGAVSDSGAYTAPATQGTYFVAVTRQGDVQTDTAVVVVGSGSADAGAAPTDSIASATPASTPTIVSPVPVGTGCPNTPAGYTVAVDAAARYLPAQQAGDADEGFTAVPGQATTLSLLDDQGAPASAPSVLRLLYPQGFPGGGSPSRWGTHALPPNTGHLYVCTWVRFSPNFTANGNTNIKFFSPRGMAEHDNNHFLSFDAGPDDGRHPLLMLQYADASLAYNVSDNSPGNELTRGAWHRIEALFAANTPGQRDGRFELWVDGAHTLSSSTVLYFLSGQQAQWSVLWFDPTYGGGLRPVPSDMYLDIDHFTASVY